MTSRRDFLILVGAALGVPLAMIDAADNLRTVWVGRITSVRRRRLRSEPGKCMAFVRISAFEWPVFVFSQYEARYRDVLRRGTIVRVSGVLMIAEHGIVGLRAERFTRARASASA